MARLLCRFDRTAPDRFRPDASAKPDIAPGLFLILAIYVYIISLNIYSGLYDA